MHGFAGTLCHRFDLQAAEKQEGVTPRPGNPDAKTTNQSQWTRIVS
jgi:hypothetical protein